MFVLKRRHVCLVLGVHWSCQPTLGICAGGHSVVLVTPLTGPGVEISFPLRVPAKWKGNLHTRQLTKRTSLHDCQVVVLSHF